MRGTRHAFALALAAGLALLYASGCAALQPKPAAEKQRIVILKLRGPKSKMVRDELVKIAEQRYYIVPQALYRETAKKLRARSMRPKHVAKVAAELNLHAVIDGRVQRRKGKKLALRLNVRSGVDGKITEKIKLQTPRVFDDPARAQLDDSLVAALGGLPSMEPEEPEEPEVVAKQDDKGKDDKGNDDKGKDDDAKTAKADKGKGKKGKDKSDKEHVEDWDPVKTDDAGQAIDEEEPPPPP